MSEIYSPAISEREASLIKSLINKEFSYVVGLIADDDPEMYSDVAAGLRKLAQRYDDLREAQA